eukprot:2595627-Pyramimonas_sp.AAC.1
MWLAFSGLLGGPLGGLWGQHRSNFGHLGGLMARLTRSEAVWNASLGRLGALLGCSRAVLEAILGVLEASWVGFVPSWG